MSLAITERDRAQAGGDQEARLAHPVIDLSKCMGCGTCVDVCPESGVLELVHGQSTVIRGSACKGISACAAECPVGAIVVKLANLDTRNDIPHLVSLGVPGRPGLFLAGEVTAHGLIRTAFEHGKLVAEEVAASVKVLRTAKATAMTSPLESGSSVIGTSRVEIRQAGFATEQDSFDLVIVGAGPAGLACALGAKKAGLSFLLVEQAGAIGGAVANYPRQKLVLTQPITLPLAGRLRARAYAKEELIDLWSSIADEHQLPLRLGRRLRSVSFDGPSAPLPGGLGFSDSKGMRQGRFRLAISADSASFTATAGENRSEIFADNVCLALGRAGTPRTLGVSGEGLPKVRYSLQDASALRGRRICIVGGGAAAVEAALALSTNRDNAPPNAVTLVHRRAAFPRLTREKEDALEAARKSGRLQIALSSEVCTITADSVALVTKGVSAPRDLPNDDVFVLIGGEPPFELLKRAGVSFEGPHIDGGSHDMSEQPSIVLPSRNLRVGRWALGIGAFAVPVTTLFLFRDYYGLLPGDKPMHAWHDFLRPGAGLGLGFGLLSMFLILANLAYLPRRAAPPSLRIGSLASWMSVHVFTGILIPVLVFVHAAAAPRQTVGGHGFVALLVLVVTGVVGRYLYAFLPRAANGSELAQAEVNSRLAGFSANGPRTAEFADEALRLVKKRQWGSSLLSRFRGLFGARADLRELESRVLEGCTADEANELVAWTRVAYRRALFLSHLEDLRALGSSWRYLHRWVAFLMVVLVGLHIAHASAFGGVVDELARLFDFGVRVR